MAFLAPVFLIVVLWRHGDDMVAPQSQSKIVLVAVLSAQLPRKMVIGSLNLVRVAVSARWSHPTWLRRYCRLAEDFD